MRKLKPAIEIDQFKSLFAVPARDTIQNFAWLNGFFIAFY
jgi:hypothetical protein